MRTNFGHLFFSVLFAFLTILDFNTALAESGFHFWFLFSAGVLTGFMSIANLFLTFERIPND